MSDEDKAKAELKATSEQVKKTVMQAKERCVDLQGKLACKPSDDDAIIASLRKVGIEVVSPPRRLLDIPRYFWEKHKLNKKLRKKT